MTIGENVSLISGGQAQWLQIARALAQPQGGGRTRIPNQGLGGGGAAEGRKKKSDLTDFDGRSGH